MIRATTNEIFKEIDVPRNCARLLLITTFVDHVRRRSLVTGLQATVVKSWGNENRLVIHVVMHYVRLSASYKVSIVQMGAYIIHFTPGGPHRSCGSSFSHRIKSHWISISRADS